MTDPEGPYWHDVDLGDLTADQRFRLDQALRDEQIPATWGGSRLRVDAAFESRLTTLVAEVRTSAPAVPQPPAPFPPPAFTPVPGTLAPGPYASPPVGPAPYAAPPGGYVTSTATNNMAIVSLVLGILSIVMCAVTGPAAIYCGVRARREIRASGESGSGMALAGIITGAVGTAALVIALVVLVAGFAIALSSSG